ncbi:hypothetical protein ACNTMW_24255 [Planosporangium sp. 12N6]|uniref:hypothetical protein n=1 Tax=Planosporangium spinosum TaxID=3402278 RepID=UPI003CE7FD07
MASALPGQPVVLLARRDVAFGYNPPADKGADRWLVPVLGGEGYGPGAVDITLNPVADPSAALGRASVLLRSAGWSVGMRETDRYGSQLVAAHGDLALSLTITNQVGADGVLPGSYEPAVAASIHRMPAPGTRLPIAAGGLIGLLVGWLGAAMLAWMATIRSAARCRLIAIIASLGLVLMLPVTALTAVITGNYLISGGTDTAMTAPWAAYMVIVLRGFLTLGVACQLVAVVLAFLPDRRRSQGIDPPPAAGLA